MLESVLKLRELAEKLDDAAAGMSEHGFSPIGMTTERLCDEIEREVSERYIERDKVIEAPLDADGVVWKRINNTFLDKDGREHTFLAMEIDRKGKWSLYSNDGCYKASECRHVNPRAVEDVLRDVWNEALDYAKSDMWRNPDEVFAERADELRDMLGGDA